MPASTSPGPSGRWLRAVEDHPPACQPHPPHDPLQPDQGGPGRAGGGSTSEEHAGRRVRLTPASAIRLRRVSWLWEGRIPTGAVTVVPGREGTGKSLLLAWLAGQVTRGELPGCREGGPRAVVYAASEDSWAHTIAPRLHAAGADLDLVYRVDVEQNGRISQLTLPLDCAGLATEISARGAVLLAADPLLSLIHSSIDTHRDRDLRTALEPLVALADSTGCAVVGLAHFNKSDSTDALNLITGSRAFSAVARAVIAIARDTEADDGSCVLSQAKNNLGRLDLPSLRYVIDSVEVATEEGPASVGRVRFSGESPRSVTDILTAGHTDEESRAERHAAADWLADYLTQSGGAAPWAEIRTAARAEGITPRTLQRARPRAGVTTTREGFGSGAVWRLDPDPQSRHSRHSRHAAGAGANGATVAPMGSTPNPLTPHQAPFAPHSRHSCQDPERGANGANGATGPDPSTGDPAGTP
ncbi:MAG: AAA family ATPase [Pseudonocardiales bacterium]|nr:AAA family ATPase [Pseudonocardiales bacterium]